MIKVLITIKSFLSVQVSHKPFLSIVLSFFKRVFIKPILNMLEILSACFCTRVLALKLILPWLQALDFLIPLFLGSQYTIDETIVRVIVLFTEVIQIEIREPVIATFRLVSKV